MLKLAVSCPPRPPHLYTSTNALADAQIFICGVALDLAQDAPSAPDASPAVEPVADQNVAQLFYRRFGGATQVDPRSNRQLNASISLYSA